MKNYWHLTVAGRKGVIFFSVIVDYDPVKNLLPMLTQEALIKFSGSHAKEGHMRETSGVKGFERERQGRGEKGMMGQHNWNSLCPCMKLSNIR